MPLRHEDTQNAYHFAEPRQEDKIFMACSLLLSLAAQILYQVPRQMSRTFFEKLELSSADLDARAHGGGDDAASDILTLSSSGLCLDNGAQQSLEVLLQLFGAEGNLADGAVNDVGLVETVLDLTSLDLLDSGGDVGMELSLFCSLYSSD